MARSLGLSYWQVRIAEITLPRKKSKGSESLFGSAPTEFVIPPGFVRGSIPGTITPASGGNAGVLMYPGSALAQALESLHRKERVSNDYLDFIGQKEVAAPEVGFEPDSLPNFLYPFQRHTVKTALRRGRAALFLECGMGKTPCQLAWARAVSDKTDRATLILAPLAVAQQTIREGAKFGIDARYATDASSIKAGEIVVTNYERLQSFDPSVFGGIVLDESSILKAYSGITKRRIIDAFKNTPYRLACSATPAPNDHLELGNHSEFLSVMSSHQMIARWFINDMSQAGVYRLKGHGVDDFWSWVSSWATMAGLPSDVGEYSDEGYILPELKQFTHVVDVDMVEGREGTLFRIPEMSATSIHSERRRTAQARARKVAELVAAEPDEPWIIWTETDYEADELRAAIPEAADLRGSESLAKKEELLLGFTNGSIRVLITKPKLAGFGLNWQHCARQAFVSATFSFESWYQAIRRCLRFGQLRPVHVHMVMGATERGVSDILQRKRIAFEEMRVSMMESARRMQRQREREEKYNPRIEMRIPKWLRTEMAN